ncbi:MAG: hypothetical protein P1U65_09070 [Minwuia sp.]|nr:hypothetical protein [Minwuia sp.]
MFRSLIAVVVLFLAASAVVPGAAKAGGADVVDVRVLHMKKSGPNIYRFRVTVRHADTGWDHYSNSWDVVAPDGTVLGTRVLHHPHENEQPFTRYHDMEVPAGIRTVTIRAGDNVHGFSGETIAVTLPE